MVIDKLNETILSNLAIRRGRIVAIDADGTIQVENDSDDLPIPCDFLRTSTGPQPELHPGDRVLFAIDEGEMRGYVIGVIEKYCPQPKTNHLPSPVIDHKVRELKFSAKEKIEFECGESTLLMKKDGKVVVRGANITTRADEANKIKGASVQIN